MNEVPAILTAATYQLVMDLHNGHVPEIDMDSVGEAIGNFDNAVAIISDLLNVTGGNNIVVTNNINYVPYLVAVFMSTYLRDSWNTIQPIQRNEYYMKIVGLYSVVRCAAVTTTTGNVVTTLVKNELGRLITSLYIKLTNDQYALTHGHVSAVEIPFIELCLPIFRYHITYGWISQRVNESLFKACIIKFVQCGIDYATIDELIELIDLGEIEIQSIEPKYFDAIVQNTVLFMRNTNEFGLTLQLLSILAYHDALPETPEWLTILINEYMSVSMVAVDSLHRKYIGNIFGYYKYFLEETKIKCSSEDSMNCGTMNHECVAILDRFYCDIIRVSLNSLESVEEIMAVCGGAPDYNHHLIHSLVRDVLTSTKQLPEFAPGEESDSIFDHCRILPEQLNLEINYEPNLNSEWSLFFISHFYGDQSSDFMYTWITHNLKNLHNFNFDLIANTFLDNCYVRSCDDENRVWLVSNMMNFICAGLFDRAGLIGQADISSSNYKPIFEKLMEFFDHLFNYYNGQNKVIVLDGLYNTFKKHPLFRKTDRTETENHVYETIGFRLDNENENYGFDLENFVADVSASKTFFSKKPDEIHNTLIEWSNLRVLWSNFHSISDAMSDTLDFSTRISDLAPECARTGVEFSLKCARKSNGENEKRFIQIACNFILRCDESIVDCFLDTNMYGISSNPQIIMALIDLCFHGVYTLRPSTINTLRVKRSKIIKILASHPEYIHKLDRLLVV